MNQLTAKISDSSCNTSYVWLGGEGGKNNSEEGSNPNNNVITIKQLSFKVVAKIEVEVYLNTKAD